MKVLVKESCCAGPGKDIYEGEIVELDEKIANQLILMGRVIKAPEQKKKKEEKE